MPLLFVAIAHEWLREKESNLHLRVQSPTCCRLHHPAKALPISNFRLPIASSQRCSHVNRQLTIGNRQCRWSRWKESNLRRSIIDRVLLPLSYTAKSVNVQSFGHWTLDNCLVDPTGLKPAPYGLKGRRSVTRAPGQRLQFRVPSFGFRVI